jgi:hypothetical protein
LRIFSTSNATIRTQIQQGGICGLFSTSNAAIRTAGRHLRIFFYQLDNWQVIQVTTNVFIQGCELIVI